jgi:sigma-B regulation protein RsbU (phosphoserine phosphatase)
MPAPARNAGRRKLLVVLWGGLLILLYLMGVRLLPELPYYGMTLSGDRVARVTPEGPAAIAGVVVGDHLVAIDRTPIGRALPFLTDRFYSGSLGRAIELTLVGPYGVKSARVVASKLPNEDRRRSAALLVTGLGFLVIGLYVALHMEGRLTLLFLALSSSFSLVLLPIAPPAPPVLPAIYGLLRSVGGLSLPPLLLHFFLLFPKRAGILTSFPGLRFWLYVPAAISMPALLYVFTGFLWEPPGTSALWTGLNVLTMFSLVTYGAVALVSFMVGYATVRQGAERRRYSVVLGSTVLGLGPLMVATLAHLFWRDIWLPGEELLLTTLLFIPMGFAYAIIRHHVLDIEVFVKRSAAFSLLTALLILIAFGLYAGFGHLLENVTGERSPWLTVAAVVLLAAVFSPLRRRVERFVDHTFFRDRYDERRMLRELGQDLPGILDLRDLLTQVTDKLSRTLRVREAAIFFAPAQLSTNGREPGPGEEDLHMAYASGLPVEDLDLPALPPRLRETIHRAGRPLRAIDLEDGLPFGSLAHDEERILAVFDGGVLVPVGTRHETLAVLALGRRSGGESYGFEDLELLRAIAGQAAVGIRNALTHTRELERQRMVRELALARDLQRRLLPHRDPIHLRMEISGGTTSCTEVGGDFYQYLILPDGRMGLAIADVSGHGVPAALIMAAMNATLGGEVEGHAHPGRLLEELNRRAAATIDPGQFLSMFYTVVDPHPHTLTFTYANAGHPPPLAIAADGRVKELATGGLLLGVDPDSRYRTDTISVEPNTIMLFFTDGLVEAQQGDLEFGEERLVTLVRECRDHPANAIRAHILHTVESFVDGDLEDDVTLIVVKIL